MSNRSLLVIGLMIVGFVGGGLLAQPPVRPTDGTGAQLQISAAGKRWESGTTSVRLVAIDASPKILTSTTTKVQVINCVNRDTGSAQTLEITDGNGAVYFPQQNLSAGQVLVINYSTVGVEFPSGVRATAGSSNVACQVVGVQ